MDLNSAIRNKAETLSKEALRMRWQVLTKVRGSDLEWEAEPERSISKKGKTGIVEAVPCSIVT